MRKNLDIQKLVLTSILLSIIVVLQLISMFVKIGIFQFCLSLIPITVGAILLGPKIGAILGFTFGVLVLITGDAAFFMSYGEIATVLIVLLKGTLAGFTSGIVYNLLKKYKFSSIVASFVTPLVNTTVFVIGTILFLQPALQAAAGGSNGITYLFTTMIGVNFLIEIGITIVLAVAVKRICDLGFKSLNKE